MESQGYTTLARKPACLQEILLRTFLHAHIDLDYGPLSPFPRRLRSCRASQARVGSLVNPCSCYVTPDRKDGRSPRVEPASKERRGENSQSLRWPYKLPWKNQRWWASPGARKAGERQLASHQGERSDAACY